MMGMKSPESEERRKQTGAGGFTMIELLVAMAVFSFMLMIIVVGFINVVRLHNQAIAGNTAQDNARTAMDELVQAVRNSREVTSVTTGPNGRLCLADGTGVDKVYYLNGAVLYRASNCTTQINPQAITSTAVQVTSFSPSVSSVGPTIVKPEVQLRLTVASNNGTTIGTGDSVQCRNSVQDRTFCSVVTLTSGAVPR